MPMTRLCSRLFLGGLKDAERLATANPEGITAVISLCAAAEVVSRGHDIEYVHIPLDDSRPISRPHGIALGDCHALSIGFVGFRCPEHISAPINPGSKRISAFSWVFCLFLGV